MNTAKNLITFSETRAELHITLNSAVGDWWAGNDKETIINALQFYDPGTIKLHISSLGGNVDDALAIHDALKSSKAVVVAELTGFVASAATIVALAADNVKMSENAFFLIHKPWVYAEGNSDTLRSEADNLDTIEAAIVNIYKGKTGKSTSELKKLMQQERWLSAKEAKELGFVDVIYTPASPAAAVQNSIPANYPKLNMELKTNNTLLEKIKALFVENEAQEQAEEIPAAVPDVEAEMVEKALQELAETRAQLNEQQETIKALNAQLSAPAEKLTTIISEPPQKIVKNMKTPTNAGAFGYERREVKTAKGNTIRLAKSKTPDSLNSVEAYYLNKLGQIKNDVPASLSNIDFDDLHNEFGACTAEVMQDMLRDIFIPAVPEIIQVGFGYKKDTIYSNILATIGEVLQPWNCDWNSKGDLGFKPFSNTVRAIKADYDLCPGDIYRTYFNYLARNAFDPYDHPFVNFIIEMILQGLARDNRMKTMFFGDYNGAGTAALDAYDGFHTIIDDYIASSDITPITTGAFTYTNPGDALDYIDTFAASFPTEWNSETIHILANHSFVKYYNKDYYTTYNVGGFTRPESIGDSPVSVFGTNWLLWPVHGFGTGDRLIAIRPGNFNFLMDTMEGYDSATVEKYRRKISIMVDAVGSAAINSIDPNWLQVNDQTNTL